MAVSPCEIVRVTFSAAWRVPVEAQGGRHRLLEGGERA